MFSYFRYLGKCVWTKAAIWVSFGICWLYTLVLLIIVPAVTSVSPITLWTTDLVNLQSIYIIILSVICGLLVVYIFRIHIENETELIILSKPIKRYKISIAKFLWVILSACVLAIGLTIIAIFTLCFGKYNSTTNPSGMNYDKILPLIGSLWLATLIISLIFDAVGILISSFASRIQIMVTLVGSSVIITTYDLLINLVAPDLLDNINNKVGDTLNTYKFINSDGTNLSYAYLENQPASDLYDVYTETYSKANKIEQYINICKHFSNLYSSFDLNDLDKTLSSKNFGDSVIYDTIVNQNNTFLNNFSKLYDKLINGESDSIPLCLPYFDTVIYGDSTTFNVDDISNSGLFFYGPSITQLEIISFIDAGPNTIYVSNKSQTLGGIYPAIWLDTNSLQVDESQYNQFLSDVEDDLLVDLLSNNSWLITGAGQNQSKYDEWLNEIWSFLQDNASTYNLSIDNESEINTSVAIVEYALIQDFISMYWEQIVPQYLQQENISIEEYLANASIDENTASYFNQSINFEPTDLKTTDGESINLPSAFTLGNFLQLYYAYTETNWFSNTSYSKYRSLNETYNESCAYIIYDSTNNTISYDWDNYKTSTPVDTSGPFFDAFMGEMINTTVRSNFLGINYIYEYDIEPYVDNTTTTIFWLTISLILWSISAIVYNRLDIK